MPPIVHVTIPEVTSITGAQLLNFIRGKVKLLNMDPLGEEMEVLSSNSMWDDGFLVTFTAPEKIENRTHLEISTITGEELQEVEIKDEEDEGEDKDSKESIEKKEKKKQKQILAIFEAVSIDPKLFPIFKRFIKVFRPRWTTKNGMNVMSPSGDVSELKSIIRGLSYQNEKLFTMLAFIDIRCNKNKKVELNLYYSNDKGCFRFIFNRESQ